MKYITQDWTSTKDGYLFFVQRLQEMLFHYSDDIVKAPVHNTQTLLEEYVDTEKDVVKGSIKQYQLDIIAKEIKSSLMTDVIVRELYKYEVIEEMAKFLDKDQRTAVHYIFNKIPKKKYYEICCKYLKENLSESNRKTEIEKGLRAWLAFLLWHGYSSEYIYRFLRNIFEESINDPEKKAQIFLNRFDFEIGKYKVYFVFYEKLKPYQKLLNERLHISFEDDGCFKQIKRKQKSFIGVMETKAYDNYSAMKRAYSALEIFLRYLEVFLNDNISVIGKNGLVIRQDTQEGIILPVKAFGYKSIKPEPRENFKTEIDTIVLGCQEKGKETYSQLNKIVDLHNAALNQQDLNDAFLNLWSALEVASVTDSSKSKIESVTDNIVSILQNDYFECIFSNILDDLKNNLGNRKVSLLLKDITEFDKEICKIAGFIFLEKYEKYREDYFANELKYYPNIRYKIYNLYEQRENREKLWHLSEKYCQRIEWHLYRLYRLTYIRWVCSGHNGRGADSCPNAQTVDEEELIEVLSEYFSELLKAKKNVIRHVTGEFQRVYKAKDENLNYEKELNAQLHKLQKMRQKYMDMYTDDLITREELNEKIGGTKQEIERLENELKMVAYHLTKGEQLETILNRTFKEIEDISDVHQMTNAQLKRIIQKIEVDKDGNVDIYLRIFGDLGLDETVLISDNQT